MNVNPEIFKAYDIRGIVPTDFNPEIARKIIQAYIKLFNPKKVVVGKDVRESGPALFEAVVAAFTDAGINVVDIGTVSTDAFYFAVGELPVDGGLTISASHNPREYNGFNFCKKGADPLSSQNGLYDIRDMVIKGVDDIVSDKKGTVEKVDVTDQFLKRVFSFVNSEDIKPFKVVANGNFGVDVKLLQRSKELFNLPITIVPLNGEPDGTFPKGPPNPLLPENRKETLELITKEKADIGVSWDADGDRCFFADETGTFIEGYFITAILATEILKKTPGATILIDPRLVWATTDAITEAGGKVVVTKPGMTIIPENMKKHEAVFAGEMSSHFYFKENYYRDNGLLPLFLILEMMTKYDKKLSELAAPYTTKYFISGEINFETEKKDEIIELITQKYSDGKHEFIDGLSVEYPDWRFNLRKSNTEPLLRINVEARSKEKMEEKRDELVNLIKSNS